jgi:hypothetical protein
MKDDVRRKKISNRRTMSVREANVKIVNGLFLVSNFISRAELVFYLI